MNCVHVLQLLLRIIVHTMIYIELMHMHVYIYKYVYICLHVHLYTRTHIVCISILYVISYYALYHILCPIYVS